MSMDRLDAEASPIGALTAGVVALLVTSSLGGCAPPTEGACGYPGHACCSGSLPCFPGAFCDFSSPTSGGFDICESTPAILNDGGCGPDSPCPAGSVCPGSEITNPLQDQVCQPPPAYAVSCADAGNEGVVYDPRTGLYWQQTVSDDPCPADGDAGCTWEDARSYCRDLAYGSFTSGWNLPDRQELFSLVQLGMTPTIDATLFPTPPVPFWTTENAPPLDGGQAAAFEVDFENGAVTAVSIATPLLARCVR